MVATLTHRMEALKSAAGRLFGGGGNDAKARPPAQAPDAQVRGGLARTSASAAAAASDPAVAEVAPTKKVAWTPPPPASNVLPLPAGSGGAAASAARTTDPTVHFDLGFPRGLTDRYDLGQLLGAGGSGVVRVAVDKRTGKRFACKTIPKVRAERGGARAATVPERFFFFFFSLWVCAHARDRGRLAAAWHTPSVPQPCSPANGLPLEAGCGRGHARPPRSRKVSGTPGENGARALDLPRPPARHVCECVLFLLRRPWPGTAAAHSRSHARV
jgi:hypothetical protein